MDNEFNKLPQGMTRVPDEFISPEICSFEGKPNLTHKDKNYSAMIRDKLSEIEGLEVDVKRLEIVEQEGTSTLISLVMEVGIKA